MGFKSFMALYLSVVIAVSVFAIVGTPMLQSRYDATNLENNHFSVAWMGFAPTDYSSDYPEYCICINNLKDDPLTMQIALQIKNQEDSAYYFKVDQYSAPPAGWSILPMAVGLIDVDETMQFVYDNAYRSKPTSISAGRLTESIHLAVRAYYDPGYTSLYSQDDFTVTFNFLDHESGTWTILYYDDFDDAQTQGWSSVVEASYGCGASVSASDTYYRSFQYSLRLHTYTGGFSDPSSRGGFKKSFDLGLASEVYLIYSIRSEDWGAHNMYGVKINGVTYFKSDAELGANIWYQFAVKLKLSELNEVEIWTAFITGGYNQARYSYLDDVYVIAK